MDTLGIRFWEGDWLLLSLLVVVIERVMCVWSRNEWRWPCLWKGKWVSEGSQFRWESLRLDVPRGPFSSCFLLCSGHRVIKGHRFQERRWWVSSPWAQGSCDSFRMYYLEIAVSETIPGSGQPPLCGQLWAGPEEAENFLVLRCCAYMPYPWAVQADGMLLEEGGWVTEGGTGRDRSPRSWGL